MFIDELKHKLKTDAECSFTLTLMGDGFLVASGIKGVLGANGEEVRLRLKKHIASITGSELEIVQIGGGEAYIKGAIRGVNIENQAI